MSTDTEETPIATRGQWQRLQALWAQSRVAVAVSVAEAAWLWLAVEALTPSSVGNIAITPFIVLLLLAGVVPVLASRLSDFQARLATMTGLLASAIVMIKGLSFPQLGVFDGTWPRETLASLIFSDSEATMPVWVPLIVTGGAWWWRQRRIENSTDDVRVVFQFGAALLVLVGAVGAFAGHTSETQIASAAAGFFGALLLAMSWARQAAVHPGERTGSTVVALWTSPAGVLVVIVAGILLVSITDSEALDTLIWLLTPLIWSVQMILTGIGWLLVGVFYPFFWLIERVRDNQPEQDQTQTETVLGGEQMQEPIDQAGNTLSLPDNVRYVLAAVVLAIIVIFVLRQVLRRVQTVAAASDVEQHIEFSLRDLLRRRSGPRTTPPDPLAELRQDPRYRNTVIIRETYAAFLRAASEAGGARRPTETARRHAGRIARGIGVASDDVLALTANYGPVRYDDPPATDAERDAVLAAWSRVAPALAALPRAGSPPPVASNSR